MKKKYFGTDGIRGRIGGTKINPEFVLKLGWAAGHVLASEAGSNVLIGKDTRISGYMLESALEAGLSAAGVDIKFLGPMPTPAIAYLTRTLRAKAGIVISASHNPFHDNGIKFFAQDGMKLPDELEFAIEEQLENTLVTVDSACLGKASRLVDAPGRYIEFCKSTVPAHTSLKGLKIVVDCAHGATYHVAPAVYRELGAEVVEICVDPNGLNINENCGATKPALLQQEVLAEKADLGIALDGDGDRVVLVDNRGEVIDGDEIIFLIARYLNEKNLLNGGVVGTLMSNLGLERAMENLNIPFVRTNVGDRYVIQELQSRRWLLGGESSGHIIFTPAMPTGDGIIASLQVLSALSQSGKSLFEFKTGMTKLPQKMINVAVNKQQDVMSSPKLQQACRKAESILGKSGRILLRASGTEPVFRVMVEGEDQDMVEKLAAELALACN